MTTIKQIYTSDNKVSSSRAKGFLGVPVTDKNSKLLNGEYKFKDGEFDITARFKEGLLDGNIYDDNGELIIKLPALEYQFGGKEYWTKGFLDGQPAVIQNHGYYKEYWKNGQIERYSIEREIEDLINIEE